MNWTRLVAGLLVAGALTQVEGPLRAHHSLAAEFDTSTTVTISGLITDMKWTNPHAWLHVDVRDAKGTVTKWAVEFGSPNSLYRRGWRRTDLPPKVPVTITGYPNRDKSPTIAAIDVKLPDGRTLFAGNASDNR
ncbi:MAG: DUF6152 family protein [Vicinamibacterales bacterium]